VSLVLSCFAPSVQRSENALNFPLSSNLIILILSVDVSEATDLMHSTNFIQVVSQGLVKLNWGMLCLLMNTSAADLPTKYDLFFRIQLAINVQIPVEYGGLGGKAVYIGK